MPATSPDRAFLDVATWARDLTPPLLRRPRLLAFTQALLAPLRELNAALVSYAVAARRTLAYNCQTLAFESLLNDAFDPSLRRIRIGNTDFSLQPDFLNLAREAQPATWFRRRAEAAPAAFLRTRAEYFSAVGFVVLVPAALVPADPAAATRWRVRLEATIRRYKYATIKHATRYVAAPAVVLADFDTFTPTPA